MTLTREERTELFLIQTRGTIATAFQHSSTVPTAEEWSVIRGEADPTMRQMGEIAWRTGFNLTLQLHDIQPATAQIQGDTPDSTGGDERPASTD